jgi:hypothetical protein
MATNDTYQFSITFNMTDIKDASSRSKELIAEILMCCLSSTEEEDIRERLDRRGVSLDSYALNLPLPAANVDVAAEEAKHRKDMRILFGIDKKE